MSRPALEWRRLSPDLELPLGQFFTTLSEADRRLFHPHPFDAAQARSLAQYQGQDLYTVLMEGDVVLAYGMLRGWDEGFEIPSLGIAVASHARGAGLGDTMMRLLHLAARRRGAGKVRLKVHQDNLKAIALYRSLGYALDTREGEQLVGLLDLR